VGLLPDAGRLRLRLADDTFVSADRVVLALGHFPPAHPGRLDEALLERPWYVGDPWKPQALAPLPAGGEALVVGTGLTAVDVALALVDVAGAARVHLVSRRAMLPRPWLPVAPYPAWLDPATAPTTARRLFARVRDEVREAAARGVDWRAVIDALRPDTAALWSRMPLVERRRFLRHARSYWEAHRHRMPPPAQARVDGLLAEGRLVVHAARLRGVEEGPAGPVARLGYRDGRAASLAVARVVNCTGPEANFRRMRHPLVLDLVGTGLGRPDPMYMGLDVTWEGALRDEDGRASDRLWAMGSLRKGSLWETTAVPELRAQAADVAGQVVASLPRF
jgi:uncharacterized NAD(P)/FAD-binding protein YdhS